MGTSAVLPGARLARRTEPYLASNGWHPEAEQAVLDLLKANTSLIRLVLPDPHADKFAREAHAQVLAANCRRGKVWSGPSSS